MSNEADRTAPKITLTVAQIQHLARLAEAARFSGSLTVGAPELLALCTLALQAEAMQPSARWILDHYASEMSHKDFRVEAYSRVVRAMGEPDIVEQFFTSLPEPRR